MDRNTFDSPAHNLFQLLTFSNQLRQYISGSKKRTRQNSISDQHCFITVFIALLPAAALLIFLPGAAGAGIIGIYFLRFLHRLSWSIIPALR